MSTDNQSQEGDKLLKSLAELHMYFHEKEYTFQECLNLLGSSLSNMLSICTDYTQEDIRKILMSLADKICNEWEAVQQLRELHRSQDEQSGTIS